MRFRNLYGICTALLLATLQVPAAAPADGVKPEQATFTPGKETKIADPLTGGVGWYVVYIPKDYTPDREWPTMFCYHGKNNDPKSWPFKELTDGQGYIVIGMEYLNHETPEAEKDVENLQRIRKFVGSKVRRSEERRVGKEC